MPQPLRYLVFDLADDADGVVTLQAMASTLPDEHPAVLRELRALLDWAAREFPNGPGPLDDGHDWDQDLQVGDEDGWIAVTLTLAATAAFAERLGEAFEAQD
ncbi:MAG: hypothetical protein MZW92_74615 [Comamonadaceae bacterium]|nr:hypothetical protein [Comamonadaceae bacterium]